jgi:hypothetical protein
MDLTDTGCKGDFNLVPALQAWVDDTSASKTASFQFLASERLIKDSGIV